MQNQKPDQIGELVILQNLLSCTGSQVYGIVSSITLMTRSDRELSRSRRQQSGEAERVRRSRCEILLGADMSHATAADVAEKASTHESTVVRLAQKLGYRGYPDLRNDLRRDEGSRRAAPP